MTKGDETKLFSQKAAVAVRRLLPIVLCSVLALLPEARGDSVFPFRLSRSATLT
jgi:hypothetical protein